MDPIACGNPIGWTIKTLGSKLDRMLDRAGYPAIAKSADFAKARKVLPEVEACARELYATKRNTVKHNRGTDIFEAGNIRFGLEMRRQRGGDGVSPSTSSATSAATRAPLTSKKRNCWPSIVSGRARIIITVPATRTTASTGIVRSSKTRWTGPWNRSKTVSWAP